MAGGFEDEDEPPSSDFGAPRDDYEEDWVGGRG